MMAEILISTTALILIVLILRRVTLGRIRMGMRYALWLFVAVRLVMPLSIGSSPVSVMNPVQSVRGYLAHLIGSGSMQQSSADMTDGFVTESIRKFGDLEPLGILTSGQTDEMGNMAEAEAGEVDRITGMEGQTAGEAGWITDMEGQTAGEAGWITDMEVRTARERKETGNAPKNTSKETDGIDKTNGITDIGKISDIYKGADEINARYGFGGMVSAALHNIAILIWIIGMISIGGYMVTGQVRFIRYLRRKREVVSMERLPDSWAKRLEKHKLQVYVVKGLPSPCLAGRSIYIDSKVWNNEDKLSHVLAHEYAHAVHKDMLWAIVRSALCTVYWFHPLMWVAAHEARQDSELAADERAIMLLGEKKRLAYGKTLLRLLSDGPGQIGCEGVVLTMSGSGKRMRERVSMIAGKQKKSGTIAGIVGLAMVLACGCSFTGAQEAENEISVEDGMTEADTTETSETLDEKITADFEADQLRLQAEAEAKEAAEEASQNAHMLMQQYLEKLDAENEVLQQRFDEITAYYNEAFQQHLYEVEALKFKNTLFSMEDTALESASTVDREEYYDYLYNGLECPMEDGEWYLIQRDEAYDVDFYGLFTQEYGCRGVKILIDDDVNTFDLSWTSAIMLSGIEVVMLERAPDGTPRTFAFKMCVENTGRSEVWELYIADRYDTGTIELYSFTEEECMEQFRNMTGFTIDEENAKVYVTYEGNVVGAIDITNYADYTVEEVVWDDSAIGYSFEDDAADQDNEFPVIFKTGIGLKLAGEDEIQTSGLSLIRCPVMETGTFGSRNCTLGAPTVDQNFVNGSMRTVQ